MRKIRKKIVADGTQQPVAVQIDYLDWLEIERSLHLETEEAHSIDLSPYYGAIALTEDPLSYQLRIRQEWS